MKELKQTIQDKNKLNKSPKTEAKGRKTILVVDDEKGVRKVAVKTLSRLGYVVLEAEDGPSALKILEKNGDGIDLVFSDVVMTSEMSGIELAHELTRRYPHIKVLLTSGNPKKAINNETIGFLLLRKPYMKAQLAETVRTALEQQEAEIYDPQDVRFGS